MIAVMDGMTEQDARNEVARLIRAGHVLIEEDRYSFVYPRGGVMPACGCALGAFYVAARGVPDDIPYADDDEYLGFIEPLLRDFPVLRTVVEIPAAIRTYYYVGDQDALAKVINALHLYAEWPRLAIATWLETGVEYSVDEKGQE